MGHKSKSTFYAIMLGAMVLSYQNCSGTFTPLAELSQSSIGPSSVSPDPNATLQLPEPGNPNNPVTGPVTNPTTNPSSNPTTNPTTGPGLMPDPVVTGNKLQVCPTGGGCQYSDVSSALSAMADGDTVEIQYGDYNDCGYITKNNVIIRGISNSAGQRPHIHSKVCGRKGLLVVSGTNTLIDNLELSNAQDFGGADRNWAGIRFDTADTSRNLKVTNCYFHDDDDGILGNNDSINGDNIVDIENSVFENCGRDGFAHGMYIGTGITFFALRNSKVISNALDGHLVKSRAMTGLLECNVIAGLNGANSYGIDFPQGGSYTVQKNFIEQGPKINNGGDFFIRFAEENQNNAPHKLLVLKNTFVNDYSAQGQINISTAADTSGWLGNIFAGTGGSLNLPGYSGPDSFTNYPTRQAAGLPAFDGTMASVPNVPPCP